MGTGAVERVLMEDPVRLLELLLLLLMLASGAGDGERDDLGVPVRERGIGDVGGWGLGRGKKNDSGFQRNFSRNGGLRTLR